jgi:hypothetical protein
MASKSGPRKRRARKSLLIGMLLSSRKATGPANAEPVAIRGDSDEQFVANISIINDLRTSRTRRQARHEGVDIEVIDQSIAVNVVAATAGRVTSASAAG